MHTPDLCLRRSPAGNFAHFLLDTLPVLLYVKRFRASSTARFGLLNSTTFQGLLKFLDPELEKRVEWLPFGQTCLESKSIIDNSKLVSVQFKSNFSSDAIDSSGVRELRNAALTALASLEVRRLKKTPAVPSHPIVLFYQRSSKMTYHGRKIPLDHEAMLVSILKSALEKWSRREELVVFNGEDAGGTALSFEKQYDLFSRATLVRLKLT